MEQTDNERAPGFDVKRWQEEPVVSLTLRHPTLATEQTINVQSFSTPITEGNIDERWRGISSVYLWESLPPALGSKNPSSILVDVRTGEWFYINDHDERVPLSVELSTERKASK